MVGAVIAEKTATLQELRTVYSLEDLFDMWEVIMTSRYNEYISAKNASKKKG